MSDDNSFFASFARSMLQRGLPAAREWMKKQLGPAAELGRVEVRGASVVVEGAVVPLGASLRFEVERATLGVDPDAVVSGGFPVRFERGRGRLRAAGLMDMPVTLVGRGGAWLDADVTTEGARWAASETPLRGSARVVVGPDAWRVDDLRLAGGTERIEASASGERGRAPHTRLKLVQTQAGRLLDTWQAIAGQPWNLPVPRHAEIEGTVSFLPVGSRADVRVQTERSELDVALAAHPDGRLETLDITGRVDLDDLPTPIAGIDGGTPVRVRARLGGRMDALRGSVQLACEALRASWWRGAVPFELAGSMSDDEAALHVDLGEVASGRVAAVFDADGNARGEGQARLEPTRLTVSELTFESAPLALTLDVAGHRDTPQVRAHGELDALCAVRGEARLPLRRVRLHVGWLGSLDVGLKARLRHGRVELEHGGANRRLRVERAERDELRAAAHLAALAVPEFAVPTGTQLWADLRFGAGSVDGEIHAEAPHSRLTVSPLRVRDKAGLDGTRVRGSFGLEDLPMLSAVGRVHVEGSVRGPRAAPFIDAVLRSDRATLTAMPEAPFEVSALEAALLVRPTGIEWSRVFARAHGGVLEARGGRVDWGAEGMALSVGELTASGLDEGVAPWFRAVGIPLAADPTVHLRCLATAAGLSLEAQLAMPSSDLQAQLVYSDGSLSGTRLHGHIGPDDLELPLRGGRVTLEGTLEGPSEEPRLAVELALTESSSLELGPLRVPLDSGRAHVRWSGARWVWRDVALQLLGGSLRSRGVAGPDTGVLGELRVADVELGRARLAEGPLAAHLEGVLEGAVRFTGPRSARGRLSLHEPRYGVLTQVEPTLSRWGLPVPPLSGRRPLRLEFLVDGTGLEVGRFEASVPGLQLRGEGAAALDGALRGELELHAQRSWLERGRHLARLGALLGGLTVPVRLEGDRSGWRASPDFRAALARAFERLFSEARESPALPPHSALRLLGTDALVDRVAAGEADAEDALELLLERGLSPEDIAERVARRR